MHVTKFIATLTLHTFQHYLFKFVVFIHQPFAFLRDILSLTKTSLIRSFKNWISGKKPHNTTQYSAKGNVLKCLTSFLCMLMNWWKQWWNFFSLCKFWTNTVMYTIVWGRGEGRDSGGLNILLPYLSSSSYHFHTGWGSHIVPNVAEVFPFSPVSYHLRNRTFYLLTSPVSHRLSSCWAPTPCPHPHLKLLTTTATYIKRNRENPEM